MEPDFELLNRIVQVQGTNLKIDMLEDAIRHDDTREFLDILFNDEIYGIAEKSIDKVINVSNKLFTERKTFPEQLEFMKNLSGNSKIDSLGDFFSHYNTNEREWFKRALLKDFPSVGIKSYNKALKKLGYKEKEVFELQLCESVLLDTELNVLDWNGLNPNDRNYVQHKYDGMRTYVKKVGNNFAFISRNNKEFFSLDILQELLTKLFPNDDFIFDGEVISHEDFTSLSRKMRKNAPMKITDFKYQIFDVIKFNDIDFRDMTQIERHNWLEKNIKDKQGIINIAETFITTDHNSIQEIFKDVINKGGEGIIIKPENGLYKYGSRNYWWKMKPVYEGTFEIIGVEKGSGKYRGKISALWIKDKYASIKCKVGSGLTEKDIDFLTEKGEDWLIGKFVDIWYNEILEKGLRFPRFKEPTGEDKDMNLRIRYDKEEADDLIPLKAKFDEIKQKQQDKHNNKIKTTQRRLYEW